MTDNRIGDGRGGFIGDGRGGFIGGGRGSSASEGADPPEHAGEVFPAAADKSAEPDKTYSA